MSIDPRTFRQTVGQFVTGVTVIAIEVDGVDSRPHGQLVHVAVAQPAAGALLRRARARRPASSFTRGRRVLRQHPAARSSSRSRPTSPAPGRESAAAVLVHTTGKAVRGSTERSPPSAVTSRRYTKAATTGSSSARWSRFSAANCRARRSSSSAAILARWPVSRSRQRKRDC